MKKLLAFLTLTTALVMPLATASAQELKYEISDKSTVVEISSEAKLKAKPDTAVVSAGVETIAKTAEAAFAESSEKMKKIYAALKEVGVEDGDISTSGISLSPYRNTIYENHDKKEVEEYRADNVITIKMKKMENVGKVIDTLVSQGTNELNGPNFSIENQDEILDKARIEATNKAQARAATYAKATGLEVKRIISISENVTGGYPVHRPMMMKSAEMSSFDGGAGSTPVSPEEQEIGVHLNFRYELINP